MPFNYSVSVQPIATDVTTLLSRLTAARAAGLDELLAGAIPADLFWLITNLTTVVADTAGLAGDAMRGTDGGALAASWTAGLATILGNFSAGRIANLDNFSEALADLFYTAFIHLVDDEQNTTITGTVGTPQNLFANDTAATLTWDTVAEYVEITFDRLTYIKSYRHYGRAICNGDGRFKLQALILNVWTDIETDIAVNAADAWTGWFDVDSPAPALSYRWTCTTVDTGNAVSCKEVELKGVVAG